MSNALDSNERLELVKMLGEMRDNLQNTATSINQFLRFLDDGFESNKLEEERIQWEQRQGSKGPYEMAPKQDSTSYELLVKELQDNNGKMGKNVYFYWLFSDGERIGRKKTS